MTPTETVELPLEAVIFREDLYPRIEKSPATVQKYAETLEVLPPIEVNQRYELIDGWHRWTAHRKRDATVIRVIITPTANDGELLEFAIERNATHGLQLSQRDKQDMARRIYTDTPMGQRGPKKERLAKLMSVTPRVVQLWLSRIDKDNREQRDAAVFTQWLACHNEEQIAEKVGMTHQAVAKILQPNETFRFVAQSGLFAEIEDEEQRWQEIEKQNRANASHADSKKVLYYMWKQQTKSDGVEHFGNCEPQWLDNLLYLYTQPFDIVVDPFAGGGSMIDVCRKRFRRYWVSDRKPIIERADEIRPHDITAGLPPLPKGYWRHAQLVFLDPPYWKQAEGQYSNDPEDLANMPLDQFHSTLVKLITEFAAKLKPGAAIALMIAPTQWKAPDHAYTDHAVKVMAGIETEAPALKLDTRILVPYESQQCTAQMVEWAKANRRCLVLTREIIVWRVAE